jgi:ribosome-associated heat shock protein Hsp15
MEDLRVDRWLWGARVFKTRSIAAKACKINRVTRDGVSLKPSSKVKVGDRIQVKKPPMTFTFEVVGLPKARVGAKLVPNYLKNVTPKSEYEILETVRNAYRQGRAPGTGRPTKKERRDLEQFMDPSHYASDTSDLSDLFDDDPDLQEDYGEVADDAEQQARDEQEMLDDLGFWDD